MDGGVMRPHMNKKNDRWTIKSRIKTGVLWAVNNSLAQACAQKWNRRKTLFLTYHGVSRDREELEAWTLVPESVFRQQMVFLRDHFELLRIGEALDHGAERRRRLGVVVTFDDGYVNNVEIALPILRELNIPAVIYVTSGNVLDQALCWSDMIWIAAKRSCVRSIDLRGIANPLGTYCLNGKGTSWQTKVMKILEDVKRTDPVQRKSIVRAIVTAYKRSPGALEFDLNRETDVFAPLHREQVSRLASESLITIGAHSHCHNLLDQIPIEEARESVHKSKAVLEDLTGQRVEHFAYPNGNFNSDVVRLVKGAGFRSAVTVCPGFYDNQDDPYTINRLGVGAGVSMDVFTGMLTGIFLLKQKLTGS
jgi:peptidoglycan/xylan/chitin deacetylase (PgdA/CDA1 family)